ncbi:MAG: 4Fe-4S binding protein [Candidatus Bathyarchaeia archaeon]
MARRVVRRLESEECTIARRTMLGLCDELVIDKKRCIGCGICVKACYKEALKLLGAVVHEGRLLKRGGISININECTFCAVCVNLCPVNAIRLSRNGELYNPAVEKEVLPNILRDVTVDVRKCSPTCDLACKESCPVEAVSIKAEEKDGRIIRILSVQVDRGKCIFCGRCEYACPQGAIFVAKPFQGLLQLDVKRCPKGCQACVEICPSKALYLDRGGNIKLEEQFCIYCGACREVCPEKAMDVKIKGILYDRIASKTWLSILEKLISPEYMREELYVNSIKNYVTSLQKIRL